MPSVCLVKPGPDNGGCTNLGQVTKTALRLLRFHVRIDSILSPDHVENIIVFNGLATASPSGGGQDPFATEDRANSRRD
jgi:hypothetical protein